MYGFIDAIFIMCVRCDGRAAEANLADTMRNVKCSRGPQDERNLEGIDLSCPSRSNELHVEEAVTALAPPVKICLRNWKAGFDGQRIEPLVRLFIEGLGGSQIQTSQNLAESSLFHGMFGRAARIELRQVCVHRVV